MAWYVYPVIGVGVVVGVLMILALWDVIQVHHSIRRNFPLIGRIRYFFEPFGPPLRQYFVTSNTEERPFDRITRSWIYQSAKSLNNTIGFGSERDKDAVGTYGLLPSLYPYLPTHEAATSCHIVLGPDRPQPFAVASWINISAMSFGAISSRAVQALSLGARQAGCFLNTGEGGVSPYHLLGGSDLIFQIGTGKFGVRDAEGHFDPELYRHWCEREEIRGIELKLSQGAKPGKGGMLPAAKISAEIANIRGIPMGQDCISPPRHREAPNAMALLEFIDELQQLGGKPVGIKLVVGLEASIEELADAMQQTGVHPDWITVDGAEGGTGSAPPSFADYMGLPLYEAIPVVENALLRVGLRQQVHIIASGKLVMGAPAAIAFALGADLVNTARGFMMALGCIQALQCHQNTCPTGVATQHPWLMRGLVTSDKATRVANYHRHLVNDLLACTHAMGVATPDELRRHHACLVTRAGSKASLDQIFPYPPGFESSAPLTA
jgi:glutamate synthase domain-containing protein 2